MRKRIRKNKGVHAANRSKTALMAEDRLRGKTFGQISNKYNVDRSNTSKRIRNYLLTHADAGGTVSLHIGSGEIACQMKPHQLRDRDVIA